MGDLVDNLDDVQDWERPPEKGPLTEEEEALIGDAVVALRRVINGCPNLPDYVLSSLQASFSLHKMFVGEPKRRLKAVR